jgi:hypothetical protein
MRRVALAARRLCVSTHEVGRALIVGVSHSNHYRPAASANTGKKAMSGIDVRSSDGAAGVEPLDAIFNNTEFLMLTLISLTQSVVAILINARTLQRTIGVGDNS